MIIIQKDLQGITGGAISFKHHQAVLNPGQTYHLGKTRIKNEGGGFFWLQDELITQTQTTDCYRYSTEKNFVDIFSNKGTGSSFSITLGSNGAIRVEGFNIIHS